MNTSYAIPFSRRSILRVVAILVIGYALTALAIQLWAQAAPSTAGGWVPVNNPSRAESYGFAASDGQTVPAASVARAKAKSTTISHQSERDPRIAAARIFALSPVMSSTSQGSKPQSVAGLSARGFYSHP